MRLDSRAFSTRVLLGAFCVVFFTIAVISASEANDLRIVGSDLDPSLEEGFIPENGLKWIESSEVFEPAFFIDDRLASNSKTMENSDRLFSADYPNSDADRIVDGGELRLLNQTFRFISEDKSSVATTEYSPMPSDLVEWSSDIRVTHDPATSMGPAIAVDSNDNVHIVWLDNRTSLGPGVYYSKLDNDGTTLIDDKKIVGLSTIDYEILGYDYPAIDIDSNDNIHISWVDYVDPPSSLTRVKYAKMDLSSNVITYKLVGNSDSKVRSPDIAADSLGNAYIVWEVDHGGDSETYYAKIDSGNTNVEVSGQRITYDGGDSVSGYPKIDLDSLNNIHMAWGGGQIHYTMLNPNGNIVVDNKQISQYLGGDIGVYPDIGVDSENNIHIFWEKMDPFHQTDPHSIDYEKLDNSGNVLISQKQIYEANRAGKPEIDIVSDNSIHLAFSILEDSANYEIYYAILDKIGNILTSPDRVTYDSAISTKPDIALDSNDKVHIVWQDNRDYISYPPVYEIYYKNSATITFEDWPMFHHDRLHTGQAAEEIPNSIEPIWTFTTGNVVKSSPAVANGKVFVGSSDHKFYALNESTGELVWSYLSTNIITSSPAVSDGKVFVGSYNGHLYAFNEDDGTNAWGSYIPNLEGWIASSPVVAEGMVFVGTSVDDIDGKIFALNANDGMTRWSRTFQGFPIHSSPAVTNRMVFFGCGKYSCPSGKVYCLDANTGADVWSYETAGGVVSSPAVVNGKVFVGSGDSRIYALSEQDGSLIWSYEMGTGCVSSSPAIYDGRVLVGSCDGTVYCLHEDDNGDGQLIWSKKLGTGPGSSCHLFPSPAVADGIVFVGSDDNKIYGLDADSGKILWTYTTGGTISSSPAIADQMIFVGSDDHKVYAFGTSEWDKAFGGAYGDFGWEVQQTSDGGYIIAGYTLSQGAGGSDVWLIKTDSKGNEIWDKTFGESHSEYGYSVQQTNDGGYVITGYTNSYGAGGSDVWLIKTDSSGNKIWDKTFGGFNNDYAYSVQQTSDGGYIIAGYTTSQGAGSSDVWLIKTDSNGIKVWDKTFGGGEEDIGYSVQQTSDGGYIIAGYTTSQGAGGSDVWLIKTDSNGIKVWDKTFGDDVDDSGRSVQQTSDGGYIITGYTNFYWGVGNPDIWLIKTDSNGNKLWDKTFSSTGWDAGYSVQQVNDGGYIIVGYTSPYENNDVWLIRTDSNGNKLWDRTFGGVESDIGTSVKQTSDDGFIVTGGTWSNDIWLMKVNSMSQDWINLVSYNYPTCYVRHASFLGEVTEIVTILDKKDSTFRMVPGLADRSCVSFESVNFPGYYLRHQGFRLKLQEATDDRLFKEDATFRTVPGLADQSATSFESYNFPGFYIRHSGFHLYVQAGSGDLFKQDATFWLKPCGVSLASSNYPTRYIRHAGFLGELTEIGSTLDEQDSTFSMVSGLADSSCISFESVNFPGYYLRHQGFRLKLQESIEDRLFKEDATFKMVPGLADSTGSSFESYNFPGLYIRHSGFHLYVQGGSDDLFCSDATFKGEAPKYPPLSVSS